jgi:hypothetical protein
LALLWVRVEKCSTRVLQKLVWVSDPARESRLIPPDGAASCHHDAALAFGTLCSSQGASVVRSRVPSTGDHQGDLGVASSSVTLASDRARTAGRSPCSCESRKPPAVTRWRRSAHVTARPFCCQPGAAPVRARRPVNPGPQCRLLGRRPGVLLTVSPGGPTCKLLQAQSATAARSAVAGSRVATAALLGACRRRDGLDSRASGNREGP